MIETGSARDAQRVYAVVDSGTTTTRLRLWRGGAVTWSGSRAAGAKDTALDGNTARVEAALAELLEQCDIEPEAIVCSGMITSNMGLFELPHLPAPAGLDDLARGVKQRVFRGLSEIPLTFIPGVKTAVTGERLTDLAAGDVLRGEEAEVAGLHQILELGRDSVYLHLGSHHKAIDVDAGGRILASRTAITGELLAAVSGQTILKSSIVSLGELQLDLDAAVAGAEAASEHGLGRALFLVRVGEQLAGHSKARMTSYLLGVLASQDLPLVRSAAPDSPIVLYGGGAFVSILEVLLRAEGFSEVRMVERETSEDAAVVGAVRIFERARALGVVA